MSRTPVRGRNKPLGLYVPESVDQLAADVAALRGKSKSAVYCDGIRALAKEITDQERVALDAIRAARRGSQ